MKKKERKRNFIQEANIITIKVIFTYIRIKEHLMITFNKMLSKVDK